MINISQIGQKIFPLLVKTSKNITPFRKATAHPYLAVVFSFYTQNLINKSKFKIILLITPMADTHLGGDKIIINT